MNLTEEEITTGVNYALPLMEWLRKIDPGSSAMFCVSSWGVELSARVCHVTAEHIDAVRAASGKLN